MIQQDALPRIAAKLHLRPGERILVFVPGAAPPAPSRAIELSENLPIRGKIRMPQGLAWRMVVDGQCVSWAVAQRPDCDGIRCVTVETDPAYRGRGYAVQSLRALRRAVDAPLLYLCSESNLASAAAARRAGFIQLPVVLSGHAVMALPLSETGEHAAAPSACRPSAEAQSPTGGSPAP